MPESRCPFYGRYLAIDAGLDAPTFLTAMPDQCALITPPASIPSPCVMELVHQNPDWDRCIRNPANNGSYIDPMRIREVEADKALEALTIEVPAGPLAIVAPSLGDALAFGERFEALGRDEPIPIQETPAERVGRLIRANPVPLVPEDVPKDVPKDEEDR